MVVIGGLNGSGGRISQVRLAGVGSGLPDVSTARTSKVCVPTGRISLYGLWHSVHSLVATRHWNATLLALSVPAKRNVATSSYVWSEGEATIDVFGETRSVGTAVPSQRTVKH